MENREPIENIVMEFYDKIIDDKNHRFKSWEHCYNYFNKNSIEIDLACLHLSFYLASWGMCNPPTKKHQLKVEISRKLLQGEFL